MKISKNIGYFEYAALGNIRNMKIVCPAYMCAVAWPITHEESATALFMLNNWSVPMVVRYLRSPNTRYLEMFVLKNVIHICDIYELLINISQKGRLLYDMVINKYSHTLHSIYMNKYGNCSVINVLYMKLISQIHTHDDYKSDIEYFNSDEIITEISYLYSILL